MKLLKFISATLSAAIVALVFSAINAHSAVDRVCNYTVGSTTTATGFANCTEEIGDLATKAFAIAATVSGTNDIEVTSAPVVTTLTDGQMVVFTAANTITGAATFKLDGTTARSLYQLDGTTALGSGDIVAGARYILSYKASNTRWLLMGTPGTGAAPAAVPYLTVGTTASLALERAIAPDGTTITGTDGGANGSYGLSVTTNGIGNAQLRQGTATSVIGRSANSTGNVADIAASADGQFLQRSSAALTWAVPTATQITNTGAGNIAASTVQAAINELDTEKQPLDATLTAWAAFNTNGLLTQTSADTFTGRTLTGPAAGITVSNGNGVSGNPTLALANDLAALEGLASTGFAVRSGTDTWVQRSLTGTANEITVANGDGVAGAPTLSLPTALTFTGKTVTGGTFSGPGITTPGAGITFAGSTSGTTTLAATATAGTTALTLPAATDTLVGKATTDTLTNKTLSGASNTITNIGNASLTNPSTTVNSQTCTLGSSCTVTVPASTGVTGLGTGVATALGAATNSTGGMALQSGAPTSGNCVRWAAGGGIEDAGATCGSGGGGGSPGGSSGQIQYNNAGSFGGFTASGDATINTGTGAVTVSNDAVTYAKMQNVAANSVLARTAATSGDVSEVALSASQLVGRGSTGDVAAVTLGAGLSMSGTTLNGGPTTGQVVNVTRTDYTTASSNANIIPFDDTIPQKTEGSELFTHSHTPLSSSNKLLITVIVHAQNGTGYTGVIAALFKDSDADALSVGGTAHSFYTEFMGGIRIEHYMTAGTTSAITFKVRGGPSNYGTAYFNSDSGGRKYGGALISSITVTEIKG